jgi:sugar phosphate isomerase/epimerase
MPHLPIALQLWSVREEMKRDFSATVAEVARIGYAGVELAGCGNLDAAGAQVALDSAGLKVAGMHVAIAALRSDPEKAIGEALLLKTRNIVVPFWHPEQFVSVAAVEKIAEELNEIGAKIRASGLQLSYHNHGGEFKIIEGRTVFDWMLAAAEPRNLTAEVDVYWVQFAGQSPEKFLRDQGARVKLLHLKDGTELGSGPVNFPPIFAAAEAIGSVEWYVVEQEKYNHTPLESVRLCFEQMKRWGQA